MKVCVIGGGINGLCCAWVLAQKGHDVCLFEKGKIAGSTSQASSKLLHGGLRYLEQGRFSLVRESLRERDLWLKRVPSLTQPIRIILPIYSQGSRSRCTVGTGLFIYTHIAGKSHLPKAQWLKAEDILKIDQYLNPKGLKGGYAFYDGQMDDYQLALWVVGELVQCGVQLSEDVEVKAIDSHGGVHFNNSSLQFDRVINVCGPWTEQLLQKSKVATNYHLDLVRGSHLILNEVCPQAYLLEVPHEKRIFFVLPWKGKTLLGTTEVRQTLAEQIVCSQAERDYLLAAYNHYRTKVINTDAIESSFAGIRPLIYSSRDPSRSSREYCIERNGKIVNVFGGKWTTALSLANKVYTKI